MEKTGSIKVGIKNKTHVPFIIEDYDSYKFTKDQFEVVQYIEGRRRISYFNLKKVVYIEITEHCEQKGEEDAKMVAETYSNLNGNSSDGSNSY